MELQLKIRLSLIAALSFALFSCEDILPNEEKSVDERFSQSEIWNKTNHDREIVIQSDDYVILCVADSHVGKTENIDNFFKTAMAIKASAVLMAGDLTSGKENDYALFKHYLPPIESLLTFMTIGNHDLWYNGWGNFFPMFGASSYLFTVKTPGGSDLFICLDTGSGTLGTDQLNWLKNTLKNLRPGYRRCIVFTHCNFYRFKHSLISNPPVEELQVLIELFTRFHVDMVLTGHDHVRNEEVFGITTYIVVGALTDEPVPGYGKLNIVDGKIQYTFENLYQE